MVYHEAKPWFTLNFFSIPTSDLCISHLLNFSVSDETTIDYCRSPFD